MKRDYVNHHIEGSKTLDALISRYRASGLGLERFAREQGVPYGRLHYWLYQKGQSRGAQRRMQSAIPVFQELNLASCLPAMNHWAAEITLPKGLAIRFSPAASPNWIASVVATLQKPC